MAGQTIQEPFGGAQNRRRAAWALGAALVLPLAELPLARLGPLLLTSGEAALLLVVAGTAWTRRKEGALALSGARWVALAAAAFGVAMLIAALAGPFPGTSLKVWARQAAALVLFAAYAAWVVEPRAALTARRLVVAVGAGLALVGILEYGLPALVAPLLRPLRESGPFDYAPRARAVLAHPNIFGTWCLCAALAAIGLWREGALERRWLVRALAPLCAGVALSGSRAVWLCAAAGLALDAALARRGRLASLGAAAGMVAAILAFDVSRYQVILVLPVPGPAPGLGLGNRSPTAASQPAREGALPAQGELRSPPGPVPGPVPDPAPAPAHALPAAILHEVDLAYREVLRRAADRSGLSFYGSRLLDHRLDPETLRTELLLSDEYHRRFGFPWAAAGRRRTASWDKRESGSDRLHLWRAAWAIFRAHPVTGGGPGSFRLLSAQHLPPPVDEMAWLHDAHSLPLQTAAEGGALGLLALGGLLAALALREARSRTALAASVPFWGAAGTQLLDHYLGFWEFAALFWLLAALTALGPKD